MAPKGKVTFYKKNMRRNQRIPVPVVKVKVPRDPPQFIPIPPSRRQMQLQYEAPSSGTTISPTCSDFFITTYGTDQYKTCIIQMIRVWTTSHEDKGASLSVAAGSPLGNTVPAVIFDDKSPVLECAKVGYRLLGPLLVPWSKAASYAKISTDSYPIVVEFTALFM